jgi:mRNA deadenylase 3'-5' endonuclease subunit Ccr4
MSGQNGDQKRSTEEDGLCNRTCIYSIPKSEVADPSLTFSVVSYNILADCHLQFNKAEYKYTAEEFLAQNYRHALLMKELKYLDGDIVCLQEVAPDYYEESILPFMQAFV